MTLLLYNATVYAREGVIPDGWVRVEGGRIAEIGAGAPPADPADEALDLSGLALIPGMIDLHVHGALGRDTMDASVESLREMASFFAQHGVTSFLPTTMTAPAEAILAALRAIAEARQGEASDPARWGGAAILGAHVEGPYIDVERRGCQDAALVHCACLSEYEAFFQTGVVRLITLAPEYPANRELIRYAIAHGAAVAAGHTRATYEQMREAVRLGVNQATHLFNGMNPLHHREPGAVGAALTLDELACQVIADNIHIHPAVLKLAARAKGAEGVLLVTDAMSGAGMPAGDYMLGGLAVMVRQGVARVADGALAGSTLTLERGLSNFMAATGWTLAQALPAATRAPARAIGLGARKGDIAPGYDADLVALDPAGQVALTVVGGAAVVRR